MNHHLCKMSELEKDFGCFEQGIKDYKMYNFFSIIWFNE